MTKFTFRLESVLNLKKRLEEQQKNTFAEARRRLDDEEEKLEALHERLSFYEQEGRKMRTEVLHVRDIIDNDTSISTVKGYIADQLLCVKKAEDALEAERQKLVEAVKERKTYEKLRENAYEEYLLSEKRSENIVTDEHNSYIYGIKEA